MTPAIWVDNFSRENEHSCLTHFKDITEAAVTPCRLQSLQEKLHSEFNGKELPKFSHRADGRPSWEFYEWSDQTPSFLAALVQLKAAIDVWAYVSCVSPCEVLLNLTPNSPPLAWKKKFCYNQPHGGNKSTRTGEGPRDRALWSLAFLLHPHRDSASFICLFWVCVAVPSINLDKRLNLFPRLSISDNTSRHLNMGKGRFSTIFKFLPPPTTLCLLVLVLLWILPLKV